MSKRIFIAEQDLIDLGFTKDTGKGFYYYFYDITDNLCLMSCDSDEVNFHGEWFVNLYENTVLKTDRSETVTAFLEFIRRLSNSNVSS